MNIKWIDLKSFGKFHHRRFYFKEEGISFYIGNNEEGKTTLFEGLKVALYGFPSIKNYPYIPMGDIEASIEAGIDDFSVIREMRSSVKGYLVRGDRLTPIGNHPLIHGSREVLQNIFTVSSEDLSFEDKDFEAVVSPILLGTVDPSFKPLSQVEDYYDEKLRELYTNRRDSKRLINALTQRRDTVREELMDFKREEKTLKPLITQMEELTGQIELLSQEIESVDGEMEVLLESQTAVEQRLSNEQQSLYMEGKKYFKTEEFVDYPFYDFAMGGLLWILTFILLHFFKLSLWWGLLFPLLFMVIVWGRLATKVYGLSFFLHPGKVRELRQREKTLQGTLLSRNEMTFSYDRAMNLEEKRKDLHENRQALLQEKTRIQIALDDFYEKADFVHRVQERTSLESQLKEAQREYNDLLLQQALLQEASKGILRDASQRILSKASYYLQQFTRGEIKGLYLEGEKLYFRRDVGELIPIKNFTSQGTKSQVYMALRLALMDLFDVHAPVFFDEALVFWDKKRVSGFLNELGRVVGKRQMIFFTCHSFYEELLRNEEVFPLIG